MTKYFVRLVWSGEPQVNPDDKRIVKETIGTFVEEQLSALDAINSVGTKLLEAGAFITHMHYVAAMECIDPGVEKQIHEAEKNLVDTFDEDYINGCVARSDARAAFMEKAEKHRLEAMKRKQ